MPTATPCTDDQPGPIASLPIPQVVAVNDVAERPLLPSFLYLPGAKEFPAGAFDLPWKSPPDRVLGRLRARARGQGAGPAGQLGQELAFARRRRPPRADPPLDGRRRCDQGLAGRRLGGVSRAPARRLERADPRQDGRRPARKPGSLPDRPGVVRPGRPRAHHGGGRQGGLEARHAPRRAPGRLLRLAGRPGPEVAQEGQGRRHHPGLRRRRRHDRLHPDRRHR